MSSLVIRNASSVLSLPGDAAVRGDGYAEIGVIENASVACDDDRIVTVGEDGGGDREIDADGFTVVPGFVDCHTHIPFFGWRGDEDAARLAGRTYESIHRGEGGIYRSARLLHDATDDQVLEFGMARAMEMLRAGTTTFEMKSGYGLSVEGELRQLRLARTLGDKISQTTVRTCLAAHAIPEGMSAGEWVGVAAQELLPKVADEGLADVCDIFVETIAFALEHAARLSETANGLGMKMRVHADQLADNQTASFAARWGFVSADHLNHTSPDGVGDLAESDTAAVLVPGATFTLRQGKRPPARDLVESGALVALGTDLNPGTSPIASMPFVIALACRIYGLKPLEALAAATANPAHVLGFTDRGRVAPGYRADLLVLDVASPEELPYRPDHNPVVAVILGGELGPIAGGFEQRISA